MPDQRPEPRSSSFRTKETIPRLRSAALAGYVADGPRPESLRRKAGWRSTGTRLRGQSAPPDHLGDIACHCTVIIFAGNNKGVAHVQSGGHRRCDDRGPSGECVLAFLGRSTAALKPLIKRMLAGWRRHNVVAV